MKRILQKTLFLLIFALIFVLSAVTYSTHKVCGWEGLGKDWPCLCIGKKVASPINTDKTSTVYYCNGFNLSCSNFLLKVYGILNPNSQRPLSCTKAIRPEEGSPQTNIDQLVNDLCKKKEELGLEDYEGGIIEDCGEYIKIYPGKVVADAPVYVFDHNGNLVETCGGMPLSTPRKTPEICKMQCELTEFKFCDVK